MKCDQRFLAVIQPEGIGIFISREEFSTFIAHFGRFGDIELYDCMLNELILRTRGVHIESFYPDTDDRTLAKLKAKKYFCYFDNYRYQMKRKYPKGRLKALYKAFEIYFAKR